MSNPVCAHGVESENFCSKCAGGFCGADNCKHKGCGYMKSSVANYLNSTVWATLRPSTIQGVGVFAIRDILKGTDLSDFGTADLREPDIYTIDEDESYSSILLFRDMKDQIYRRGFLLQ